jgi:hypothetical protein
MNAPQFLTYLIIFIHYSVGVCQALTPLFHVMALFSRHFPSLISPGNWSVFAFFLISNNQKETQKLNISEQQ